MKRRICVETSSRNLNKEMAVALTSKQCKFLNDSAKSELSLVLGFSGNESSSDISDYNESS